MLFDAPPSATRLEGDVWVRIGDDASATVRPLVQREKNQSQAQLSPDQRWVAYVSDEAGPNDVFVAEFRAGATAAVGPGQGVRISEGGGFAPRWRRDGRELFYLMRDGSVLALTVDTGQEFRPGKATRLFRTPDVISDWGVTPDGSRFLFAVPVSQPPPLQILENWQATLPKPAPR